MSRRRILVVDDEPGMLRAVCRILERGYDVTGFASPVEALAAASEMCPDLAILDVRMPVIDGFELTERLKRLLPEIDVILMTGSAGESDQKLIRAIRHEAFYFLQKPFDREVLRTLVERCLTLRTLAETNRSHVARLEGEMAQARAFQASLLPPPHARFGALRLDARYVPCAELCGDFYDYVAVGDLEVAFIVADVSGHGASAAMLTGVVKSAFHSCHHEGYEPAAVIERIAAGIRGFDANRFVTAFCAKLRVRDGMLRYVNAAHPPALVWTDGAPVERLAPTGGLISPVLPGTWREGQRTIAATSRLLLYTDGVTEAPGDDDLFGMARLEEELAKTPPGAAVPLDRILEVVAQFGRGRPQRDDATLLSVSRV